MLKKPGIALHQNSHEAILPSGYFQLIDELEERLVGQKKADAARYEKELKKIRLRYEILARTEVNSRLSEINKFLSDKSQEQEKEQQTREKVTQDLQADYAKRLQQSREELAQIKDDLQGTYTKWEP